MKSRSRLLLEQSKDRKWERLEIIQSHKNREVTFRLRGHHEISSWREGLRLEGRIGSGLRLRGRVRLDIGRLRIIKHMTIQKHNIFK